MTARNKIRERRPRLPIGRLSAVAASCLAIAIGIASSLDPFTICCRASISGFVVGVTIRLLSDFIKLANIRSEAPRGIQ